MAGRNDGPADHPAKPDKHSPNSALSSAAGCQRQPKRAKNANLTMPKQAPHEILGVPEDATASQVRKAYLRLALRKHPDKGGDAAVFRTVRSALDTLLGKIADLLLRYPGLSVHTDPT